MNLCGGERFIRGFNMWQFGHQEPNMKNAARTGGLQPICRLKQTAQNDTELQCRWILPFVMYMEKKIQSIN